jgi:hypothetical protein
MDIVAKSREPQLWKTSLLWGLVLFLVMSFGAFVGERFSGTCMFILMPYFAALAAALPVLQVGRFGAGIVAYLPSPRRPPPLGPTL